MGWIVTIAGICLLVFLVVKSLDRQTVKSVGTLLKVLAAVVALLILWAIIASV